MPTLEEETARAFRICQLQRRRWRRIGEELEHYPVLASWFQRAEYRVISETIADEMTREWIEFKSTGDDKAKATRIERA